MLQGFLKTRYVNWLFMFSEKVHISFVNLFYLLTFSWYGNLHRLVTHKKCLMDSEAPIKRKYFRLT